MANPDLEDPRQSPKESESGETRQENSDSEQVSLEETVEELSHLEVGTNEKILMESAKKEEEEEEEDGSDKQECEEDEMDDVDPPASPPASDSSSISIPPSPIPKEVIFKSASICIRLCRLAGIGRLPLHNTDAASFV